MDLIIQKASVKDIDELLGLYVSVYGDDYPLEIGTNKKCMHEALESPEKFLWLVMRDQEQSVIAGSTIIEMDREFKIGKVTGVTVSPKYRGTHIASKLIKYGVDIVLNQKKLVNSLYATSRTLGIASQSMFLNNGFLPLGIFPNARKIKTYETLTLMGIFAEGVLEQRALVERVPSSVAQIFKIGNEAIDCDIAPRRVQDCPIELRENHVDSFDDNFEFIFAPNFVNKRFEELFVDDDESVFYPFHTPNLIISSEKTELEIFASFNKKDHYCVWITANGKISALQDNFKNLIFQMKELGIYYVETLVRADYFDTITFLTENRFLPSAIYPAMREEDGEMHDYILLNRTMVPLDFSDAKIHDAFKPYVNSYAKQWLHLNLSAIEGIQ